MSSKRGSTVSERLVPLMVRVMDRVMMEVPADMTITQGEGRRKGGAPPAHTTVKYRAPFVTSSGRAPRYSLPGPAASRSTPGPSVRVRVEHSLPCRRAEHGLILGKRVVFGLMFIVSENSLRLFVIPTGWKFALAHCRFFLLRLRNAARGFPVKSYAVTTNTVSGFGSGT